MVSGETEIFYYHGDHLGSTNLITDSQGTVVQHLEFDPWGKIHHSEGPSVAKRHLYTGKEIDETGLIYFGARYYDPSLGRWMQPDPIVQYPGDPQTLNRYTFVRNNPINLVDPHGYGFFKKLFKALFGSTVGKVITSVFTAGIAFAALQPMLWATGHAILEGMATQIALAAAAAVGGATYGGMTLVDRALFSSGLSPPSASTATGFQQGLFGETPLGYTASFAAGFTPYLGDAVDTIMFTTGVDPFTGEELTGLERYAAGVFRFVPVLGLSSVRQGMKGIRNVTKHLGRRGYRYVGPEEAELIRRTKQIPNWRPVGPHAAPQPKVIHYTDAHITSRRQAKEALELTTTPTHRVEFDLDPVKADYGGLTSGDEVEFTTRKSIRVRRINPLEEP